MSSPSNCCQSACAAVEVISVPGVEGEAGLNGEDGQAAFTLTTASFVVPATSATVVVSVVNNSWMALGEPIFIPDAGTFEVSSKTGTTSVTLTYLDYDTNTETGETINAGTLVTPSGFAGPATTGALPNQITDNSGGTASDTIAAGVGIFTLAFPIQLAAMTTSAADLLTNYVVGFAFKLLSISFSTTTIGVGASASQILNLEIGAVNVTGGTVTLTEAGTDTLGELTAGTAITGANTGTAADTLSIEVAAGGTIFTAGAGVILVRVQNLDSVNAFSSLSDHLNDIIAALQ